MSQGKKWGGVTVPGEQSWPQRTQSRPPHLTASDSWVFAYFFRSSLWFLFALALPSSHNPSLLLQQTPTPGSSHRPSPLEFFFPTRSSACPPLLYPDLSRNATWSCRLYLSSPAQPRHCHLPFTHHFRTGSLLNLLSTRLSLSAWG